MAYIGDGDNVCNSLVMGSAIEGVNISVACPRTYIRTRRYSRRHESSRQVDRKHHGGHGRPDESRPRRGHSLH